MDRTHLHHWGRWIFLSQSRIPGAWEANLISAQGQTWLMEPNFGEMGSKAGEPRWAYQLPPRDKLTWVRQPGTCGKHLEWQAKWARLGGLKKGLGMKMTNFPLTGAVMPLAWLCPYFRDLFKGAAIESEWDTKEVKGDMRRRRSGRRGRAVPQAPNLALSL